MEWLLDDTMTKLIAECRQHADQAMNCLDNGMKGVYPHLQAESGVDTEVEPVSSNNMQPLEICLNTSEPRKSFSSLRAHVNAIKDINDNMDIEVGLGKYQRDAVERLSTENTYLKRTLLNEQRQLAMTYTSLNELTGKYIALEAHVAKKSTGLGTTSRSDVVASLPRKPASLTFGVVSGNGVTAGKKRRVQVPDVQVFTPKPPDRNDEVSLLVSFCIIC
jgi:hypothetical protein